ncbi:Uma2 family endonuclease [bacterium]|nr:MAG: Uma2 family endonuclease [bacterium]
MAEPAAEWISPEEYLRRERLSVTKNEYFNGRIYPMEAGPSAMAGAKRAHVLITGNIGDALRSSLRDRPCETYESEMRVKVDESGHYTYPDVAVACEPQFEDVNEDTLLNPLVIVEVLSPSTEPYDRGTKFEVYEAVPSIQEILYVRQDRRMIERNKRIGPRQWLRESFTDGDVPLESLGFTLSVARIYERVRFDPNPPLR